MNDPYIIGRHPEEHRKWQRRKRNFWLLLSFVFVAVVVGVIVWLLGFLKPETKLTNAPAVTKKVTFAEQLKHYDEANFSIDLPVNWRPAVRQSTVYRIFAWEYSDRGSSAAQLEIYEDTIPTNFAVNRVQIVKSEGGQLKLDGPVSDNCSNFTRGMTPLPGQVSVPAKWQNTNFLCDQFNRERDVIDTSSPEAINSITLTTSAGAPHKFFFAYTNQDITPDYGTFANALSSFKMK